MPETQTTRPAHRMSSARASFRRRRPPHSATTDATPTVGDSVTLTATVTSTDGPQPTGVINFTDNGSPLGSASLNGSGIAILTINSLSPGAHSIVANYGGDTDNALSSSSPLTETVAQIDHDDDSRERCQPALCRRYAAPHGNGCSGRWRHGRRSAHRAGDVRRWRDTARHGEPRWLRPCDAGSEFTRRRQPYAHCQLWRSDELRDQQLPRLSHNRYRRPRQR